MWMTLLGPLFIFLSYLAGSSLNSEMSGGLMNPTLSFEVLFWSLGAYNEVDQPNAHPN